MFDLGPRETLCRVHRLTLERADGSVVNIEALEPLQSDHRDKFQVCVPGKIGLIAAGATLEEAVNALLSKIKGRRDVATPV